MEDNCFTILCWFLPYSHRYTHVPSLLNFSPTSHPNIYTTICKVDIVGIQLLSRVWLLVTLWTAACQGSLSFTVSQSLLKLMSIESVLPSNHLILCFPLLLLPSIFPSIRALCNEKALCIRWPKYWSFSFSISPSNEYSGLISFRTDWLDLPAVQETLQNLLHHHSSKASFCCQTQGAHTGALWQGSDLSHWYI